MSNLIPTQRTDKNGRTVTRHMKPDHSTTKPAPTLPVPTMTFPVTATTPEDAANALINIITNSYPDGVPAHHRKTIHEKLNAYSPATLHRIKTHSWTMSTTLQFILGTTDDWTETKVNDYLAVTTGLPQEDSPPALHYDSWKLYPELHPANNDGDYPAERLNQLLALYRVTEHMILNGNSPYYINDISGEVESVYLNDDKLREFLLNPDAPYNRDDIVSTIIANNVCDPDRIKEMLDLNTPSISSGVL